MDAMFGLRREELLHGESGCETFDTHWAQPTLRNPPGMTYGRSCAESMVSSTKSFLSRIFLRPSTHSAVSFTSTPPLVFDLSTGVAYPVPLT